MKCKICKSGTSDFGKATLMGKHVASYRSCGNCGFIFASEPYWLPEAYSSAITCTDMGTVSRTESCSLATKAVIDLFYHSATSFLDYGAGYGMFVRRMRDLGYNFSAYDTHCLNMLGTGARERWRRRAERTTRKPLLLCRRIEHKLCQRLSWLRARAG